MTCIVGLVADGHVWMGADSQGSGDCALTYETTRKVFRLGQMLIGYTTAFRFGQIVQYSLSPTAFVQGRDPMAYLSTDFVDALRKVTVEKGWHPVHDGREQAGQMLVALDGRLFEIQDDLAILEDERGYATLGCGREWARGSLHTSQLLSEHHIVTLAPQIRVKFALEAAEAHDIHVGGPFTILSTE